MSKQLKGLTCGIVAAVSYGTNPLFSLHLFAAGLDVESVLFYRFVGAALIFGGLLKIKGVKLGVTRREIIPLLLGGVIFALSSQTLYQSFLYMDAGLACSILFVYPILVAVMMAVFFHERATWQMYGCMALALTGIALLYHKENGVAGISGAGLVLVLLSSLCYSLYIVGVDHSRLHRIASGKMTFWMLCSGALLFFLWTGCATQLKPFPLTLSGIGNVVGLALLPTVLPIFFINVAIKQIGPTYSAILGALEPVTALLIGVFVFQEKMTLHIACGVFLILFAVITLVSRRLSLRSSLKWAHFGHKHP